MVVLRWPWMVTFHKLDSVFESENLGPDDWDKEVNTQTSDMARDYYQVLFALCVYYIYVKKLFFSFITKYILVLKIYFRLKECGQFYLASYVRKMQVWWRHGSILASV